MMLAAAHLASSSSAICRFSSSGTAEPSHMWDWKSGSSPRATRSTEMSSSGRTKPSSLSLGQWSVCSATLIGYFFATSAAYAANATEPVTMSLMVGPERYSAPPVETWMIPSLPASAKPASAAFSVWEEDTLIAGNANDFDFAASSISAYFSGVAIGMPPTLVDHVHEGPRRSWEDHADPAASYAPRSLMPAHRHWTFLAVLGVVLALLLSGCGGKDDTKKPDTKPGSSPSSSSDD